MTTPQQETLSLEEVEELACRALITNGCDLANANAVARNIAAAERDGSQSHGLFRLPGYVAALRSGKVNGSANPVATQQTESHVEVDGDNGFAPLALERGIPLLADAAADQGIAVLTIRSTYHFAALWPETEALTDRNLSAIACVNYAAVVAPFGGKQPIFGTNPISFAWPRPGRDPVVFDMSTAAMAQGEIQIAARDGHQVPEGTGLDRDGNQTTDPGEILSGVQLPFGEHKGSAIALMVELLAAGATGELFSSEAAADVADGGPPRGGEFIIALSPERLAGKNWAERCESFFAGFATVDGARFPGARRHEQRRRSGGRRVSSVVLEQVRALLS